jgi:hypothetical protein
VAAEENELTNKIDNTKVFDYFFRVHRKKLFMTVLWRRNARAKVFVFFGYFPAWVAQFLACVCVCVIMKINSIRANQHIFMTREKICLANLLPVARANKGVRHLHKLFHCSCMFAFVLYLGAKQKETKKNIEEQIFLSLSVNIGSCENPLFAMQIFMEILAQRRRCLPLLGKKSVHKNLTFFRRSLEPALPPPPLNHILIFQFTNKTSFFSVRKLFGVCRASKFVCVLGRIAI